jgi:hypothetical protein
LEKATTARSAAKMVAIERLNGMVLTEERRVGIFGVPFREEIRIIAD